ncbi:MAG: aromatic-ring-hydroxylating dioxygenase subunit beta [Pseudomonadota bacterium]|nr:aromatic-ring-hydroxylating dioxygenase subunit beta [Pseudomonadota bacterium]
MVSDIEEREITAFIYREARLADESRYEDWEQLWADDKAVYWVPRSGDPDQDPDKHVSHIYDNRQRIATRVRQLGTGYRYSQTPPSHMRRLISNIEIDATGSQQYQVTSNFILAEQNAASHHKMLLWAGQATHKLRRDNGELKMHYKKVVLVNAEEPLPTLAFLI